jgi:hypothetical protein
MMAFSLFKERVIDVPEYRIDAKIKAPIISVDVWLVNQETGEKIYHVPDAQFPNPIEVRLKNTGKKPIENLEVILEFVATGDFTLSDERYSVKPKRGFSEVNLSTLKNTERRVKLDLFNPGDEFMYSATATRPVTAIAYARFPGLSFYQEYTPVGPHDNIFRLFVISFLALSGMYGMFLVGRVQKRIIERYGIRNILREGFIKVYWGDRTKTERLHFCTGFFLAIISCLLLAKLISNT